MFRRHPENPLISPRGVKPSRQDFEIVGTFNAGAAQYGDETVLLVRVAERPIKTPAMEALVLLPHLDADGQLRVHQIRRDDPAYDTRDTRFVVHLPTSDVLLTSISHLRLARSSDGVHFTVDEKPWLKPTLPEEAFGIEDARITQVGDTYYVNYSAISASGIKTGLVTTRDFVTIERQGIIFPPANRDVTLFPERVNGKYVCYHRPMPGMFGGYNIWMAESPDMVHWGRHRLVLPSQSTGWESGRVGGGAPPIRTEHGWLSIYHAADPQDRYCLGAFLTPLDDPGTVIARAHDPILAPEAPYEVEGFFGNVVFTCGIVQHGDTLRMYYGASDETIALAEAKLDDVLRVLLG